MTHVLLIRHASTDATGTRLAGRATGHHLSEAGRTQASDLAARLAPVPLAAVYTSPLERCTETAEAVAVGRGLAVAPVPGLNEVDYGRWTGRPLSQLARTSLWKDVQRTPSRVRFPEGETLAEVQRRSVSALEDIAARHRRGIVAVVTHGDVIRLAVAHYAGVHIDLFQRLVVGPASLSVLALGDGIPRILRLNDSGSAQDLIPRRRRRIAPSRDGGVAGTRSRRGP